MKNLKRVLSLALAIVMLFGMMVVASAADTTKGVTAAAQLSDWDTVTQKDAVAMMVDLGVIKGYDDGTFQPKGKITRAEWSSLVYKVQEGLAATELTGGVTFSDVPSTSWYAGFVSFLVENKTIAGRGDGTFDPKGNISVIGAAKTLLTSLGYVADDPERGYEGTGWEGHVYQDGRDVGLFTGIIEQNRKADITREDACQMIVNALNARLVKPKYDRDMGVKYIDEYVPQDDTLGYKTFQVLTASGFVEEVKGGKAVFQADSIKVNGQTLNLTDAQKASLSATPDVVGQTVNFYVKKAGLNLEKGKPVLGENENGFDNVVMLSSSVSAGDVKPTKTVTGGIDWDVSFEKTVEKDGKTVANPDYVGYPLGEDVLYVYNGQAVKNEAPNAVSDGVKPGNKVELFVKEGAIWLVRIYEYKVAQIGEKGVKVTKAEAEGESDTVTIAGITEVHDLPVGQVKYPADLKADDIVLYYASNNSEDKLEGVVIEKAASVNAVVTRIKNGNAVINGKEYVISGLEGSTLNDAVAPVPNSFRENFEGWVDGKTEYTFHLDKNGAVCWITYAKSAAPAAKQAIMIAAGWKDISGSVVDLTGSVTAGYGQAKLMFLDGTTSDVVKVVGLDGRTLTGEGDKELKKSDFVTEDEEDHSKDVPNADVLNKFYTYSVNDKGEYTLTAVGEPTEAVEDEKTGEIVTPAKGGQVAIEGGAATKGGVAVFKDGFTANSKTVFIYGLLNGTTKQYEYKMVTGFRNMPALNNTAAGSALVDTRGISTYVFMKATGLDVKGTPDFVFASELKYTRLVIDDDTILYELDVIGSDGKAKTLTLRDGILNDKSFELKRSFYSIVSANGVTTEFATFEEETNPFAITGVLKSSGNDIIKCIGGEATDSKVDTFEYDEGTKFYFIDNTKAAKATSGSFNPESYTSLTGEEDYTDFVYIIAEEESVIADAVYVVRMNNSDLEGA